MNPEIGINMEPLPGYRLIERLGAGGYGEVWRAEAPGGLMKAIKFVFGQHHEKRASHELRALERVRSVRHPFLLSLERIEVVDGRLLVVTEVADGSVKDRFEICRREGLPGIPRGELIGYMRDAADALDFMGDAHDLQHLDIKPENLLVLAGHIKVADFGLVKDVRHSQASLVGGMTPLYASPEVFRGTPSSRSDQYSLAILYQEMLTGTLPFTGRSSAELSLQHHNDVPDLNALAPDDRLAVSRALTKDPHLRYVTCREFVDALCHANRTNATSPESATAATAHFTSPFLAKALPSGNTQTDIFDDDHSPPWNAEPEHRLIELPAADATLFDLPPPAVFADGDRPAPTLLLGVGGAAGKVLTHFRRMISEQWGGATSLPSIPMLLLDTDVKALSDMGRRDYGLSVEETVSLPLRRPQHYRDHSQQLLQWMSRRWLYNIPRSLRTEGLRPLGRLALADHARQIGQCVRRAVVQSLTPESVAKSSQTIGRAFRPDTVQVCLVASISGGTGSGMSLDLGYMVRAVLDKLGIPNTCITGIMMHATGGDPRHCELARVNAFSWLAEFNHFQQSENSYPGDSSCGLPPHNPGVPVFDHTYLVHLGEQLDNVEFDQASESVAEYLRLSVLTPAGAFVDACRRESESADPTPYGRTLRSFGIQRREPTECQLHDEFARQVAKHVLLRWQSTDDAQSNTSSGPLSSNPATATTAEPLIRRLQLTSHGIAINSRKLVEMELGADADTFLPWWLTQNALEDAFADRAQQLAIDRIFDANGAPRSAGIPPSMLGRSLATIVRPLESKLRSEIRHWITAMIEDPRARFAGAVRAASWTSGHFQALELDLTQLEQRVAEILADVRQRFGGDSRPTGAAVPGARPDAAAHEYFRLRLDEVALAAARHTVKLILSDSRTINNELDTLGRTIEELVATLSRTERTVMAATESGPSEGLGTDAQTLAASALQQRLTSLAAEVDQRLQIEFLAKQGGLMKTVLRGGRPRAQLIAKLREIASQAVCRALAGIHVLDDAIGQSCRGESNLRSALAAATPSLVQFGGRRRLLAILPRDTAGSTDGQDFAEAAGTEVFTLFSDDDTLTLCVEADRLSIQHVAVELIQCRRDRADFAQRVHSRTDILWTPLLSDSSFSLPCAWSDNTVSPQAGPEIDRTLVL